FLFSRDIGSEFQTDPLPTFPGTTAGPSSVSRNILSCRPSFNTQINLSSLVSHLCGSKDLRYASLAMHTRPGSNKLSPLFLTFLLSLSPLRRRPPPSHRKTLPLSRDLKTLPRKKSKHFWAPALFHSPQGPKFRPPRARRLHQNRQTPNPHRPPMVSARKVLRRN